MPPPNKSLSDSSASRVGRSSDRTSKLPAQVPSVSTSAASKVGTESACRWIGSQQKRTGWAGFQSGKRTNSQQVAASDVAGEQGAAAAAGFALRSPTSGVLVSVEVSDRRS